MFETRREGEWLSAHLFFGADIYGDVADAVALDVIAPVVARCRAAGCALGYFFIRYRELGAHLRLRLRVTPGGERETAELLLAHVRASAPSADLEPFGYGGPAAAPVQPALWPVNRTPDGSAVTALRWIPYDPEFARYGGSAAIGIAEAIFEASSDVALELLRGLDARARSKRLGRALLATLAMLHVCFDGRGSAATFAHEYGTGYLRTVLAGLVEGAGPWERAFEVGFNRQADALAAHIKAAWACMDDGEPLPSLHPLAVALTEARAALAEFCDAGTVAVYGTPMHTWAECARSIVPSYIHMNNNRLGVSIAEEAYLAHLIYWTLNRPLDDSDSTPAVLPAA